jgi:hypothetical protein
MTAKKDAASIVNADQHKQINLELLLLLAWVA